MLLRLQRCGIFASAAGFTSHSPHGLFFSIVPVAVVAVLAQMHVTLDTPSGASHMLVGGAPSNECHLCAADATNDIPNCTSCRTVMYFEPYCTALRPSIVMVIHERVHHQRVAEHPQGRNVQSEPGNTPGEAPDV